MPSGAAAGKARATQAIRVVIADDSYLVRVAVNHVLDAADSIDVVAECADRQTLEAAIESEAPDVVVTDIRMPPSGTDEGLQIAADLRLSHPEIGVVVLSQFAHPRYGLALLENGSNGRAYLLKERIHRDSQLVTAVGAVARGDSFIDPRVVENLVAAHRHVVASPLQDLTPRELEILTLVARGQSNQAIADELVLTKRAIEKHINAIFLKLGLTYADDISRRVKATLIFLAEPVTD